MKDGMKMCDAVADDREGVHKGRGDGCVDVSTTPSTSDTKL